MASAPRLSASAAVRVSEPSARPEAAAASVPALAPSDSVARPGAAAAAAARVGRLARAPRCQEEGAWPRARARRPGRA